MKNIAIVLFNLGGPDSPAAVKPFLFNLFNDPAIITLPNPFRFILAKLISRRRESSAQAIYAHLGGKSPLLTLTLEQQSHLEALLKSEEGNFKVFTSMRYYKPFSREVVKEVKAFNPDEILLLPLYPQFSTTTSNSSINDWQREARKQHLKAKVKAVCCYGEEEHFINAHVTLIKEAYNEAKHKGTPRIIFSAHGLPEKIITAGDPYQWQIEQTSHAIMQHFEKNTEWSISYQSRVGPLKWIGPSTEEEIIRAGNDKVAIVIVPIAFVSEHSETLVELDIDYKKLAEKHSVPAYVRVAALGTNTYFMQALSRLCLQIASEETDKYYNVYSCNKRKKCPDKFGKCPRSVER